jgi:hypothetical protein
VADDFIQGLVLFNALSFIIKSSTREKIFTSTQKWCKDVNINYDTLLMFLGIRESLITELITAGINIHLYEDKALLDIIEEEFINQLTRIKHCIYDGFKLNLAIKNSSTDEYETVNGLKVKTPELFTDDEKRREESAKYGISFKTKPKYVLFDKLILKQNKRTQLYEARAQRSCILDGYVNVCV